jgi:Domain of unknown function (DUF1906)
MGKRKFLTDLGWGLAPIYLGQQSEGPGPRNFTSLQGYIDGGNATDLARTAGFPECVIYLDVEGSMWNKNIESYFGSWIEAVTDEYYSPGVYCSPFMAVVLSSKSFLGYQMGLQTFPKSDFSGPVSES